MKKIFIFWFVICLHMTGVAADRPNILWLTSEDNGKDWLSCYGGKNTQTPNLDQLAEEGFRYLHCFDNSAVCAPTRSTWITGMHCLSLGTQPMRSKYPIPESVYSNLYPDLLRKAGYFLNNGGKKDYNFSGRDWKAPWNKENDWNKRESGQPFFFVINLHESHEGNTFGDVNNTKNDPEKMTLRSYHPDIPDMRKSYAKYADAVERMDKKAGEVIGKLKEDGLYEDTIIIHNSDHGGVMPRSKRFMYSSGIHCPLIIRIPEKWKHLWPTEKPGMTVDRLVSFVDMPKTWLSIAGAEVPETYQGRIFLGKDAEPEPKYHFHYRGRADESYDMVRGIRGKRYSYIKNYMPYAPNGQRLKYLWSMKGMKAWEKHYQDGKTTSLTDRFFRPRVSEEFYDNENDFDNVKNLIDRPEHQDKIKELKRAMREQQLKYFDSGFLPEDMRVQRAESNDMTLYEMVRDPKLYPLKKYMDLADLALKRDAKNLELLVSSLENPDAGIRWWAINGLKLLEGKAKPAFSAVESALQDEADEVRIMAAWIMDGWGEKKKARATLESVQRSKSRSKRFLSCVKKWMTTPDADGLKSYIKNWKILGPFKDKSSKGTAAFSMIQEPGDLQWEPLRKGVSRTQIDLQEHFGEIDNCSAFVRTTILAPEDISGIDLEMKCDDKVVAMVNEKFVSDNMFDLKKGKNTLTLKLIENGGRWYFWCRIMKNNKSLQKVKFVVE